MEGGAVGRRTERGHAQHRRRPTCASASAPALPPLPGALAQHVLKVLAALDRFATERAQVAIEFPSRLPCSAHGGDLIDRAMAGRVSALHGRHSLEPSELPDHTRHRFGLRVVE